MNFLRAAEKYLNVGLLSYRVQLNMVFPHTQNADLEVGVVAPHRQTILPSALLWVS